MSAKMLHALTDDNPDLQRQIGCMTGIFEHFMSGRRLYGQQHKRLPPSAHPHFSHSRVGAEESAVPPQTSSTKTQTQNQQKNIEYSIDSQSSSSCSSSFSSVECKRNSHTEPSSYGQSMKNTQKFYTSCMDNNNISSMPWIVQANFVAQNERQSIDFRHIVKESMYRERQVLLASTETKGIAANHLMNPRDSSRPPQVQRLVDESSLKGANRKPTVPVNLNESLRVLARLKDGPWYLRETPDPTRASYEVKDISFCSVSKECPRFSYDGREVPRNSFDSRNNIKSTNKMKELPRLSLDGRDYSSRSSKFEMKSDSSLKNLPDQNNQKDSESRQSPGIVAKLMGLEALPNSRPIPEGGQKVLNTKKTSGPSWGSSKVSEENRHPQLSTRVLQDPVPPQRRNAEVTKKTISISHVPNETAPWSLPGGSHESLKKNFRSHDLLTKVQASQSVFSIEEQLKELKSVHSQKDLTAILKALHGRMLDTNNVTLGSVLPLPAPKVHPKRISPVNHRDSTIPETGQEMPLPIMESCSPSAFDSPIVIMKPAKFIEHNFTTPVIHCDNLSFPVSNALIRDLQQIDVTRDSRQAKSLIPKSNSKESVTRVHRDANKKLNSGNEDKRHRLQNASACPAQISSKLQQARKDSNRSSSKSIGSSSPRLQQRNQEAGRRSRQTTSSLDSNKPKKQAMRQTEIGHKVSKLIADSAPCSVPGGDHTNDISSDTTRHLSHQADEISMRSDSNISSISQLAFEVTSTDQSLEMNSAVNASATACNIKEKTQEALPSLSDESGSITSIARHEQPSPVSVLDPSLYKDDLLPSPTLKTPCPSKDVENHDTGTVLGEESSETAINHHLSSARRSLNFSSSKSHGNKLASIEDLVQKLQRLSSSHNEAAKDHIASLCEKTTPGHSYVSEILLASGFLLKDLSSDALTPILPHSSGNLINPDLFFVLEKTNASRQHKNQTDDAGLPDHDKTDHEGLHRRLLFDTVNELLISKLLVLDAKPWIPAQKLSVKVLTGQRLLHEVCTEIDTLACERSNNINDVLNYVTSQLEDWSNQKTDTSAVVLDIERMIFKDLVDEIVNGKGWAPKAGKQNGRHHQGRVK